MPHIKVKPFTVSSNSPFNDDCFNRKSFITSICNLSLNIEEPLVIGFRAPWGHGKSTIISRLESYIHIEHESEIGLIKYDAFKNDYISDVFVSITSSISTYLETCIESEDNKTKKNKIKLAKKQFINSGGKICKSLLKNAAIRGVKYASAGILDLPEIQKDLEKTIEGVISDSASNIVNESIQGLDNLIKERLSDASKDQILLTKFTSDLNNVLEKTGRNRLIFVIDELDRCRPSFSVEVLEKIKHFFSCEKVLFILVYNKEQLENSITHIYGVKNPNVYLQRFIDLESDVSIKYTEISDENTIKSFINYIVKKHEFSRDWSEPILIVLENSFKLLGNFMSLRAVERICIRVASYCLIRKEGGFIYDKYLIVILCMLLVCKPKYFDALYERAKISSTYIGKDNDLLINIYKVESVLKEYLDLIKNSKNTMFDIMYQHIIYYLYITDEKDTGQAFLTNGISVGREKYFRNCCNQVSIFSME